MRLGFSTIFAWRPHVEHMHFLAELAKKAGHDVSFLSCDADLDVCYNKALHKKSSSWVACIGCRLGGIRSYQSINVKPISELSSSLQTYPHELHTWSQSSVSTLERYESDSDFASPAFIQRNAQFVGSLKKTYAATRQWIDKENLEAICVFNGRIDATRAVLEAAQDSGIPYISLERTLFGDGVQLLPNENCLGLRNINRLVDAWKDKPLTHHQALKAASHIASRFLRANVKEWRAYNLSAQATPWPVNSPRHKILLLPSSRNEFWGHPDWHSNWGPTTAAYDAIMAHLDLKASDVVLRCHPNWGERIGPSDGSKIEKYFTDWAQRRGIHCIASVENASTLNLIERCDAIVVCGGSAAFEAGILGKQVIATLQSFYQNADFQTDVTSPQLISNLKLNSQLPSNTQADMARHIQRQLLRFIYTMTYRIAQYVDHVRCVTTTQYAYARDADPNRLTSLFQTGVLEADDATHSLDIHEEDQVLDLINQRNWSSLVQMPAQSAASLCSIHRRPMFRAVDHIRSMFKRGDL